MAGEVNKSDIQSPELWDGLGLAERVISALKSISFLSPSGPLPPHSPYNRFMTASLWCNCSY